MFFKLDLNNFFDRKNSKKFIILGVILLAVGVYCMTRKNISINIFSYGLALVFFYGSWLSLREINELGRYASKDDINKARISLFFLFIIAVLLILFPKTVNSIISILIGVYLIYNVMNRYIKNRKYEFYNITGFEIIKFVIGVVMIVSPLFLSRFLIGIFSTITIIFGMYFIITGVKLESR